ncbi:MAG: response regulator transcription factor [Burkholderiales bacterium]
MRILIVEDDRAVANGLIASLKQANYAVDHVPTGEAALSACEVEHYDTIILDIGLPGIDGFEVLRRLRERKSTASVLVLTAYDAVENRVKGLDLGADDYLAKPFALPELEARLRMLARRHQLVRSSEVQLGQLVLDTAGRRAHVKGVVIELTAREWSVLEYLVMRVGQVVSKDRLMQALWSWDREVSPNALEVHMSRLRGKLADAGIEIRTIRGFGYLVAEPTPTVNIPSAESQ